MRLRGRRVVTRDSRTSSPSSSHRFNLCPKEKPSVSPPKLPGFLVQSSQFLGPSQKESTFEGLLNGPMHCIEEVFWTEEYLCLSCVAE